MALPVGVPVNPVDYLNPRIWTGLVRQLPIPANYVGYKYLPARDVPSDRLMWDILQSENPMAPFVALDAESPRLTPQQLSSAWADIVYMRYKRVLKESDVRAIRDFGGAPVLTLGANMAQVARANIARDAARLSNAIDARTEWMQIQALLGSITVTPQGDQSAVQFTINYPVVQRTAPTLWTDTVNSDPLRDMENWFTTLPYDIGAMIATRTTFLNIARNEKLMRRLFVGLGVASSLDPTAVTFNRLNTFFSDELGLEADRYFAYYTDTTDNGVQTTLTKHLILPDNKVIFLPKTIPVGYTAHAPAALNNYMTGKFTWVRDPAQDASARDPYTYEMGVGFYGLPLVDRADLVVVATVG